MFRYFPILILILFLNSCVLQQSVHMVLPDNIVQQMEEIYDPLKEKGFCISLTNGIHNIKEGSLFSIEFPLCDRADIVMHTHPFETVPSIIDWDSWGKYKKRYRNDFYGIYAGKGKYKIYER